jgi:hypothetical protein
MKKDKRPDKTIEGQVKEEPASLSPLIIPPLKTAVVTLVLVGDAPLIVHRWSAKAREMILNKQTKKAVSKKETRDPEADYHETLYLMGEDEIGAPPKDEWSRYHTEESGGKTFVPCFPAIAFKSAAVTACTSVGAITKVAARQFFHTQDEFVPVEGRHRMREDMVRIGMGTADLRFRAEFPRWKVRLPLVYNTAMVSVEQLAHLFQYAGFSVGVGEHRPERNGRYGRFHVEVE